MAQQSYSMQNREESGFELNRRQWPSLVSARNVRAGPWKPRFLRYFFPMFTKQDNRTPRLAFVMESSGSNPGPQELPSIRRGRGKRDHFVRDTFERFGRNSYRLFDRLIYFDIVYSAPI